MLPRLQEKYYKEIIPAMKQKFGFKNDLRVPRLKKIVVNMGIGEAIADIKILEKAAEELATITGQKPVIRRAKKAIANFKIKQGMPIGIKVTLRRRIMYEFLDRLVNVAMPRIRDFSGVSKNAFDTAGNYNLGVNEQGIFPELEVDRITRPQGMNISFVVESRSKEESLELLRLFGMPFSNP
ncbi:MAG: 50S ribosomal protein L5 [Candidatus Omnitrophota bacterium]